MTPSSPALYYRSGGAALLRAAVTSIDAGPGWWPDLQDPAECRTWLRMVWCRSDFADAVWQSSPGLALRVNGLVNDRRASRPDREIRRACGSVLRYALRATGRPTPFGLFAGTIPIEVGGPAAFQWGGAHRPVARVDTQWLADVTAQLEGLPELLARLDVQFTNLAVRRGGRVETPFGPQRASVAYTRAVQAIHEGTMSPVCVSALTERLLAKFPGGSTEDLQALLAGLIHQGFLITNLRAPFTVTDPLSFLVDRLESVGAAQVPAAQRHVRTLARIRTALRLHNQPGVGDRRRREEIIGWMADLSTAGRCPLAVDLVLDCQMRIPEQVTVEMQHAASAMLRLSRRPAGDVAWRDFHTRFVERYGTGVLVPVTDVTDLDAGLGYPASYLGSVAADPVEPPTRRDQLLLGLAMRSLAEGSGEVELTEDILAELTADNGDGLHFRRVCASRADHGGARRWGLPAGRHAGEVGRDADVPVQRAVHRRRTGAGVSQPAGDGGRGVGGAAELPTHVPARRERLPDSRVHRPRAPLRRAPPTGPGRHHPGRSGDPRNL
jgi:hypothetical protein